MSAKHCIQCGRVIGAHLPKCMFCGAAVDGPIERPPEASDILNQKSSDLLSFGEALLSSISSDASKTSGSFTSERSEASEASWEDSEADISEDMELLPLLDSDVLSIIPASSTEEPVLSSVLHTASTHKEKRLRLFKHIWTFQQKLQELESQVNIGWAKGVHQAAVVIEGPQNPECAKLLQRIFQVDLYQAKLMARKLGFFVARRAATEAELYKSALQYREMVGHPAVVVTRAQLLQQPDPWLVVQAPSSAHFDVQSKSAWLHFDGFPNIAIERSITAEPALAVIGEVEVQRFVRKKKRTSGKSGTWEKMGQGRIGVVDLHAAHCVLRFAEGLSQLTNLPGYVPDASKKSHRSFAEKLNIWNPKLHCLPSKLLTVSNPLFPNDDSERFVSHAWADWERYSRMARALYGLSKNKDG